MTKKVSAMDCRKKIPLSASRIEVEYDPSRVQNFDTRGKCATTWQETWGRKVDVEIDGEHCMLYLEQTGQTRGHTMKHRNFLKEM